MIAVIDYKAGNLTSVMKALHAISADALVTADPEVVRRADKVVLPGVGHFAATRLLSATGLTDAVRETIARGAPFLGICVGLQWLFEGSTEAPGVAGMGHFEGSCDRFQTTEKVPHVGWNSLSIRPQSRLMDGVPEGSFVYYTHSYKAPVNHATVAVTDYGESFTGAIERDNVMGVQFHPEKSAAAGLRVLSNFVRL
ncbi:MAG TPA: imidazole glycerol phosphate synthase subunit HisH [Acidisarcina sp.]